MNRQGGYRLISVHRLGEMPIQSCGQSVSAPRGKAGARLNAHTELRAKRQRSAREAINRNRPIENKHWTDVESENRLRTSNRVSPHVCMSVHSKSKSCSNIGSSAGVPYTLNPKHETLNPEPDLFSMTLLTGGHSATAAVYHGVDALHSQGCAGRGLHSSTIQLNSSRF